MIARINSTNIKKLKNTPELKNSKVINKPKVINTSRRGKEKVTPEVYSTNNSRTKKKPINNENETKVIRKRAPVIKSEVVAEKPKRKRSNTEDNSVKPVAVNRRRSPVKIPDPITSNSENNKRRKPIITAIPKVNLEPVLNQIKTSQQSVQQNIKVVSDVLRSNVIVLLQTLRNENKDIDLLNVLRSNVVVLLQTLRNEHKDLFKEFDNMDIEINAVKHLVNHIETNIIKEIGIMKTLYQKDASASRLQMTSLFTNFKEQGEKLNEEISKLKELFMTTFVKKSLSDLDTLSTSSIFANYDNSSLTAIHANYDNDYSSTAKKAENAVEEEEEDKKY